MTYGISIGLYALEWLYECLALLWLVYVCDNKLVMYMSICIYDRYNRVCMYR